MLVRLLLLAISIFVGLPAFAGSTSGAKQVPLEFTNLLIILLDDVGRDDLNIGSGQSSEFTTPQMDALRGEGLTLSNFYVNPLCASTRASLLAGWATTRTLELSGPGSTGINREGDYWPEAVNDGRAYVNVGLFGKSGIGESQTTTWNAQTDVTTPRAMTLSDGYPWGAVRESRFGFDHFEGFGGTEVPSNTSYDYRTIDKSRSGYDASDTRTWWEYSCATTDDRTNTAYASYPYTTGENCTDLVTERITDDARSWIVQNNRQGIPWVAWVNYNSVHTPYSDPATDGSRWTDLQQTGDDEFKMMYHVDKEIGYLVEVVNSEDTLVVILGDNGSYITDGEPEIEGADKGKATEYGVNVGAIVWGGPVKDTPRVSSALHSVSDFYPTILELTGTALMNANVATVSDDGRYNGQTMTLNGKSLMADIRDEGNPGNQFVFGSHVDGLRWVRGDNGYKYKNCSCSSTTAAKLRYCGLGTWDEQLVQMTGATEGGDLCNSGDCSNLTGADLTAYNELKAALTTENEYVNGSGTPLSTCTPDPY